MLLYCNLSSFDRMDDMNGMGKKNGQGSFDIGNSLPTTLRNLREDTNKRNLEKEVVLPSNYRIKPQDVICGNRGSKEAYHHVGNERYRVVVNMRLQRYSKSDRSEKSEIVKEIVDVVRAYGGRFIRYEEERWKDIGNWRAREKTGQFSCLLLLRHDCIVGVLGFSNNS